MSSLPVPLSPVMSTEARAGATCSTVSKTKRIAGLEPMILPIWFFWERRSRSCAASVRSWRLSRARASKSSTSSTLTGLAR